jgi:hypothetical protein
MPNYSATWVSLRKKLSRAKKNPSLQDRIQGAVFSLVVVWFLVMATIDPSTRPMFKEVAKIVVVNYIGRLYIPPPKQK